ncbi:MAG: hypothetical protein U0Q22_01380 [Acidimicrobiales bacterium]
MMLTRGSKVFFGLALAAFFGGIVYGVITNGMADGGVVHVITGKGAVDALLGPITFGYKGGVGDQFGYALFMGSAVCSFGAGIASLAFRDSDPEALAELENASSVPPVSEPADLSDWPIATAFSLVLMTLGLAVGPVWFAIGAGALAISAIEWTIKAWSERATGDPEVNRLIRNRLMHPVEIPVAGVILLAILAFSFSRILLASSEKGAVWVAIGIGAVMFLGAVVIGTQPQVRRGVVVAAVLIGGLAAVTLGIVGALHGERKEEGSSEHASSALDYSTSRAVGETDAS